MKFERLDCGGIRADDEGARALEHALAVVRWLAEDYASDPPRCSRVCSRVEQVLEALEVVDEVIVCAIGREQEQRDEDGRRCHCYDGSTPCIHHPAPWRAERVSDEAWAIYDAAGEWVREVIGDDAAEYAAKLAADSEGA